MASKSEEVRFLENPHVLDPDDVLKHYSVNLDHGLNDEQVARYRDLFGSHTFVKPPRVSLLVLFVQQFDDLLVKILLSAAIISFFLTLFDPHEKTEIASFVEPMVILFILVLNAIVGVWQEANAERALDALKKLQPTLATCLRNGVWTTFETENLVVGDVVKVKNGDKIPSDLRVAKVLSTSLLVEQSQLTGESFLIYKTAEALPREEEKCELQSKRNILFGSTTVCSGSALGIVVATGMKTEIGSIQSAVIEASGENCSTPLQKMLNEFGTNLSKAITVICVLVWAINFKNFSDPVHGSIIRGCVYYFKIAIALAVAAIPEGLPAVITTCLALGTRKMAKRNAIVRKLPSIETLGCTTVICSDKTGTLTTNRMTTVVVNLFNNQDKLRFIHMPTLARRPSHDLPGGFGESGLCVAQSFDGPIEPLTHTFLKCASLCSDVSITTGSSCPVGKIREKDVVDDYSGLLLEGEPTEVAIIEMVNNLGKHLLTCDSAGLDHMGGLIFNPSQASKSGKRPRKFSPRSRSPKVSDESRSQTPTDLSRSSSFKDDVQSLSQSPGANSPKLGQSWFSRVKLGKPENKAQPVKSEDKPDSTGESTPTALLYRKYLRKQATLEFCRTRKMMSVIAKDECKSSENMYVFTKGAPESVLEACSSYMLPEGAVRRLGKEAREEVLSQFRLLASEALRVLAFAFRQSTGKDLDHYKSLSSGSKSGSSGGFSKIERDLVFLGLVGIMDPPRPEVKDSISKCMRAGIRVIMITGDNKLTAEAIARKVGIIKHNINTTQPQPNSNSVNHTQLNNSVKPSELGKLGQQSEVLGDRGELDEPIELGNLVESTVNTNKQSKNTVDSSKNKNTVNSSKGQMYVSLTGKEFEALDLDAQKRLLASTSLVFSRTEPRHKRNIVSVLKDLGEIVAMTGDGVNDAPALKMADIGISMGINGTEVAKEASDMILADDNFKTIVSAIEEGRCIYSNMKAFIRYLISSNIGEVVSIFMTAMLGIPEGMLPVQLLWVNLVTDGPPATALGFNPADPLVMKREPRSRDDKLIDRITLLRYILVGIYVGFATCGIFVMYFLYGVSPNEGNTLISFERLRDWANCQNWRNFSANNIYDMDESCDYFTLGKVKASTLSLTTLVMLEMFNAFNALSEDSSLLSVPPWKNLYLILATLFSVTIHCLILYLPILSNLFNVVPLDRHDWKWVLIWSFPVVLIDEAFKLCRRLYKLCTKPKLHTHTRTNLPPRSPRSSRSGRSSRLANVDKMIWKSPSSSELGTMSFGDRLSGSLASLLDKVAASISRSSSDSNSQYTTDASEEEMKDLSKL